MDKHKLLHNLKATKECPIKWEGMNGSEVIRTCRKCGALVFSEEQTDSPEFDRKLEMFADRNQQCMFRRTDGKLMLRRCGLEPDYRLTFTFAGWTGSAFLLVAVLGTLLRFLYVAFPLDWLFWAYLWNIAGLLVVARTNRLSYGRTVATFFAFLTPIVLVEVYCYIALVRFIYWYMMFPRPPR